jgi:glutamate--cysteine ligase
LFQLDSLPGALYEPANAPLLTGILRGVEKESLRVQADGQLAQSTHPRALGSALIHPQITTDFSESLLEFITPPSHRIDDVMAHLGNIHRYTYAHLQDEMLWCHSMPCPLPGDKHIPIARYGNSNVGHMKTIYREGLSHRYGRVMQTVAGIHYNFSLPKAFWAFLHTHENSPLNLSDFRTKRYFDLIRNFRRYYWLLIYLFGASPAVCESFVKGREHDLMLLDDDGFTDSKTLYRPYGTSLRMGDLGYQSTSQEALFVCYNQQKTYLKTLVSAIRTPYPPYEAMGLKDEQGQYRQLNTGLLQIENEFYSAIRPKRTARTGETALTALAHRGVEYVEVRCLDIDPYEPLGVSHNQMRFLDTFLLFCLLQPSPESDLREGKAILSNQKKVVNRGREPGLTLCSVAHGEISLQAWAESLMTTLKPVAEILDQAHGGTSYGESLALQAVKVADPEKTPSAKLLADMRKQKLGFTQLAWQLSQAHDEHFRKHPLPDKALQTMQAVAARSLDEQVVLEQADTLAFEEYLARYYAQYSEL